MHRHPREFTASGLRSQQDLTSVGASFKELDGITDGKPPGITEIGIPAALERVVSSTQGSPPTLDGMPRAAFEEMRAGEQDMAK